MSAQCRDGVVDLAVCGSRVQDGADERESPSEECDGGGGVGAFVGKMEGCSQFS